MQVEAWHQDILNLYLQASHNSKEALTILKQDSKEITKFMLEI
jgi:hypothetical protein